MPTAPSYTLTHDTLTVVVRGRPYSIRRGAEKFEAARQAVLDEQWDVLPSLLSPGLAIEQWLTGGDFTVVDGFVTYQGDRIDQSLNARLMKMADEGKDPSCWLKFWTRLQANPSYRSVNQLYAFLVHEGIAIDEEDGFILAYKSVRSDYLDHHSGKHDNHPGAVCEMPRNKISDDPNTPCHEGFHVGALKYASTFGSDNKRIVICKVDPADVVCVPYDSSQMKVRVCKYVVVGNYSGQPLPSTSFKVDVGEPVDYEFEEDDSDEVSFDDEFEDESDADNEEVPAPRVAKPPKAETPAMLWNMLDSMPEAGLMGEALATLRPYASNHLKIVGACKIIGGKEALVKRILEVRRK
jgi:hypothetical protein